MKLFRTKLPENIDQMLREDYDATIRDLKINSMLPISGDLLMADAIEKMPPPMRQEHREIRKDAILGKYLIYGGILLCGKLMYDHFQKRDKNTD